MALFDGIQRVTFKTAQTLFGDLLSWMPSNNPIQQTAKVLYNSPESKQQLGDADKYDYSPFKYSFEYFEDQLIGLKMSVDAGGVEVVTIKDKTLCVVEVTLRNDGKTNVAYCNEYE